MNNNEQFDQFFNQQLHTYTPDVPADAWDKLVAAQKNKKPKAIVWWLNKYTLLVLLFSITAIVGLLINNGNFNKTDIHSNTIIKKATAANNAKKVQANTTSIKNKPLQINHVNNTNYQPVQPTIMATQTQTIKKSNKVIQVPEQATVINNKLPNISTYTTHFKPHVKSSLPLSKQTKNYTASINKSSNAFATTIPDIILHKTHKKVKHSYSAIATFNNNSNTANNSKVGDVDGFSMKQTTDKMPYKLYADIEMITANSLQKKGIIAINKAALLSSPGCPTVEKNAAGNKKYVSIFISPDVVAKKYSDTGTSTFLNKRKESTQIISAFTAGINYTNVFANGVSISAGLQYSQVNEKFSFVQSNYVQLTYTINPATGDTTNISSIMGTRYKTTINRYRTIDVPLLIGYEMGNTNWHVNVHAGAVINVYSWQKGDALDINFKPTSITTGIAADAYKYKTNIGVGIMVGASVFYKLNEKLHLMAAPFYRYNFSPISNATMSLQEKFSAMGIKLGLRVDL